MDMCGVGLWSRRVHRESQNRANVTESANRMLYIANRGWCRAGAQNYDGPKQCTIMLVGLLCFSRTVQGSGFVSNDERISANMS